MSEIAKSLSQKNTLHMDFMEAVILDLDFFNLKNYHTYYHQIENWLASESNIASKIAHARGVVFKAKLHYFGNAMSEDIYEALEAAMHVLRNTNDIKFIMAGEVILIRKRMVQGKFKEVPPILAQLEKTLKSKQANLEVENEFYYIKSVYLDIVGDYEGGAMVINQRLEECKDSSEPVILRQVAFFKLCLSSIFFKLSLYHEALVLSIQVYKFAAGNVNSRLFLFTIDTIPLCFLFLNRFKSCRNFILNTNGLIKKIETRRTMRFRQSLLNRCYIKLGEEEKCQKVAKLLKGEVMNKFDQLEFDIDNISFDFRKSPKKKFLQAMLAKEVEIETFPANSKLVYYKGLYEMSNTLKNYKLTVEINEKIKLIEGKINTEKAKNMTIGYKIKNDMEALKLKMKANEEKAKTKHEFLMGISHDLRSPLASIISATNLLDKEDLPDEMKKKYIYTAKNSAAGLIDMIDELLEVSSIESRAIVVNLRTVYISDILSFIYESHKLQAVHKGLSMSLDMAQLKMEEVNTDSHLLQRILSNLLTNAIKYSDKGEILMRAWSESEFLNIEIKDQGQGIEEEKLQAIFELYAKTGSDASRRKGSHGIGLFIVKNLVQALGGEIQVSSVLGEGSSFSIKIQV